MYVGDIIDRFGKPGGKYFSPAGTPFANRSVPPTNLGEPYAVYRVAKPWDAGAGLVEKSKIGPAFDQAGYKVVNGIEYGIQYKTQLSAAELVKRGYLVQINGRADAPFYAGVPLWLLAPLASGGGRQLPAPFKPLFTEEWADIEKLADQLEDQGWLKYSTKQFTEVRNDEFGQRIEIVLSVHGVGPAAGKSVTVKTQWLVMPDKAITLLNPYSGPA